MRTIVKDHILATRVPARRDAANAEVRRVCRGLPWIAAAVLLWGAGAIARAEEPQWIWSPAYEKEQAPAGVCYFRRTFELIQPEQGEIQITADDRYDLYVNGRPVGKGQNWKTLNSYDITKFLLPGINAVAVKATNSEQGNAGLVARVMVKQHGGTHVTYSTDNRWQTALKEFPHWEKTKFNDRQWMAARTFGALGATLPWGNDVLPSGLVGRFKAPPEFHVEWVIEPKQTGSLIAMTFDEFGQIIAAREKGPLLLIRDDNRDGLVDTVSTLCEEVKNCQGILAVSGKLLVVGEGPQGTALYRLTDEDHDGRIDRVETLIKFTGEMGEHGPHALTLGPEGLIYMVAGNFAHLDRPFEPSSPHRNFYEGDLLTPKYEDARGHAAGIKAPGGTILRTDTAGTAVELVAGGLQNPYDLAFNRQGELFTADSDMEWDSGMPWYRPTRINHVVPGAEFGWRSGWAKWPNYYLDSLPGISDTGRGSPTGIESYDHYMYPVRYQNTLFVGDWARGKILSVKIKPEGSSYKAQVEDFVEGRPLNVTDLSVGPDGLLYFCTGGRDTEGGIYRVLWEGEVPPAVKQLGTGVLAAVRQPQIQSAWGRQQVALVKQQLGEHWGPQLIELAENTNRPAPERARALDLLQWYGPYPTTEFLVNLSHDESPAVRLKTAYLMGVHSDAHTQVRLVELLGDTDHSVQRTACEALARASRKIAPDKLVELLGSPDRFLAWSARRALETLPVAQWRKAVLEAKDARVFERGAVALLMVDPSARTAMEILDRAPVWQKSNISDAEFLDLLRVIELALVRGKVPPEQVAELGHQLSREYPSRDAQLNRELVRLMVYFQEPAAAEKLVKQLQAEADPVERMHVAMHARFLTAGWTTEQKLDLLKFYEEARNQSGGYSFAGYIDNVSRDFFANFTPEERQLVLADGAKWPSSALAVLAKLPMPPGPEVIAQLQKLDRQIKNVDSEPAKRLRIGIIAVLGASRDPRAMAYLREVYDNDPERRVHVAMGLAQQPDGDNWSYLVNSLSVVEGTVAQMVLVKLAEVEQVPDSPEAYRQAILRGLMLGDSGGRQAIALLEKWTGKQLSQPNESWQTALAAWQKWFAQTYPQQPEAKLPIDSNKNRWTYQELLSYLTGPTATHGDPQHGAQVFVQAQCIKCHRMGDRGETIGPDLSTVGKRFQKKEILQSILYPSQTISDQYASRTVITNDGRSHTGIVGQSGGVVTILPASGDKITVNESDVEQIVPSKISSMPDGLLNSLSVEDIADLFAYLSAAQEPTVARGPAKKAQ